MYLGPLQRMYAVQLPKRRFLSYTVGKFYALAGLCHFN